MYLAWEGADHDRITLAELHQRLCNAWAVYRFLVQPHGELGGLSAREALKRGKINAVLAAAESIGSV